MKLDFNEKNGMNKISEVFKWSDEKFEKCARKLALAVLDENLSRHSSRSKTEVLADWLKDDAERLGFTFETPNDIFMLGYCFNNALEVVIKLERDIHRHSDDDEGDGPSIALKVPKDEDQEVVKSILKGKLKEAIREIREKTGKDVAMIGKGDLDDDNENDDDPPPTPKKKEKVVN